MKTKFRLILLGLYAIALIAFSLSSIQEKRNVIEEGKSYKFRIQPIDPTDIFRGKYVILNYDQGQLSIEKDGIDYFNDRVYVRFTTDSLGFAKIDYLDKSPPDSPYYFETTIKKIYTNQNQKLTIAFPFDRYYMEESKAPEVERVLMSRDTSQVAYAEIYFYKGEGVMNGLFINDIPAEEYEPE